jgi:Zn-dependent protease
MLGSRAATDIGLVARQVEASPAGVAVFGVPVRVDLSWLVGWGLATWTLGDSVMPALLPGRTPLAYGLAGGGAATVLLLSLAIHEAAHCVAARRTGLPVRRVTLSLFGGATECDTAPPSPGAAFRIAVAGPLASFAMAVTAAATHVVLVEQGADPLAATVAAIAAVGNLGVVLLNLAPGLPLDGGGILLAALWRLTGRQDRARRIAARTGTLVGAGVVGVAALAAVSGETALALWTGLVGFSIWSGEAARDVGARTAPPARSLRRARGRRPARSA